MTILHRIDNTAPPPPAKPQTFAMDGIDNAAAAPAGPRPADEEARPEPPPVPRSFTNLSGMQPSRRQNVGYRGEAVLPDDVILLILELLPLKDLLCGAAAVSRRWARIAKAPRLVAQHLFETRFVQAALEKRRPVVLAGHSEGVMWLVASRDTLFSASVDKTVRCWS